MSRCKSLYIIILFPLTERTVSLLCVTPMWQDMVVHTVNDWHTLVWETKLAPASCSMIWHWVSARGSVALQSLCVDSSSLYVYCWVCSEVLFDQCNVCSFNIIFQKCLPPLWSPLRPKQAIHVLAHVDDVINISANSIMVWYAIPVIYGWRKCTKKCRNMQA